MKLRRLQKLLCITALSALVACDTTSAALQEQQPTAVRSLLPSLSAQQRALGYDEATVRALATATQRTYVDVTLSGLIMNITDKKAKRAVVVYDRHHHAMMKLPPKQDVAAIKTLFGVDCDPAADCVIPLDRVAIRVVDKNQKMAENALDHTKAAYSRVPRLGAYLSDLHPDVLEETPPDRPEKDRLVVAFFEINRGTFFNTQPSICDGRFDDEPEGTPYREFSQSATATLAFTNQARLEIRKPGKDWEGFNLVGSHIPIEIANHDDIPGYESHFEVFQKLRAPGSNEKLPGVIRDPDCVVIRDLVPGCGNSSWP